ncbi:MAG: GntR family transcriptional regulator [bacterium]
MTNGTAYEKLAATLRKQVKAGQVGEDGFVASEVDLTRQHGISRVTVRRAVDDLVEERLVQRRPGKGLYVRKDDPDKVKKVWLILDNIGRESFAQFFRAAQRMAKEFNFDVQLKDGLSETGENLRLLAELAGRDDVDGALIIAWHKPEFFEAIFAIKKHGIPFVLLDHHNAQMSFPSVVADNYRGGWLVAEHLYALGHRQFAFMGAHSAVTIQKRLAGFRDYLAERGVALPASQILEVSPDDYFHGWERVVDRKLSLLFEGRAVGAQLKSKGRSVARAPSKALSLKPQTPTALFASCDRTAQEVFRWCSDQNISIPGDLSVVGFDNEPVSKALKLTTVSQPFAEMGTKAMILLNAQIEGKPWNGRELTLPVELVIRRSTQERKA